MADHIGYRILGPFEVVRSGRSVDIRGPKLRALLVILLLSANRPVSRDALIHELWGEHPPAGAKTSLDVYISRLRKALETPANGKVLVTRPGAYCLLAADDKIDSRRFERVVAEARIALAAGRAAEAAGLLRAALALWRGNALTDLRDEPFAQSEIARLEEMRLGAIEDRIDADLAACRHADVICDLEGLVAAHPLRERLHGQLMIALYRSGRQADALQAYRSARSRLVDELGLEPGPALRRLEQAILRQDAGLELPVSEPLPVAHPTAAEPEPASRRRAQVRFWRRPVMVGTVVAAVVALTGGVLLGTSSPTGSGSVSSARTGLAGGNGLEAVDTSSSTIVAATRLKAAPEAMSGGGASVWVADPGDGTVARIDPRTGAETDRILVGGEPGSLVAGDGSLWVASTVAATVARIDLATDAVTQRISLPGASLTATAFGHGKLWIADAAADELFMIDPSTGRQDGSVPLDVRPSALLVADGALWVAGYNDAVVEKISLTTGRPAGRVHVGNGPLALAYSGGALWVANGLDSTVTRVDPAALKVGATIPVASGPSALAVGSDGSVWVASRDAGRVSRIAPRRGAVVASVPTGGGPTSLAVAGRRLWVGVGAAGTAHRGGTLVIATSEVFGSVDPAFYDFALTAQFTGLAYDTLVTFQKSAGPGGLRLVPDLALAVPDPAPAGREYSFRLRPGIRYSDGQPLRAGDFRRAIERLFRLRSPGASYFTEITGARACARHPSRCDLSQGIVTDDAAGTVVFHLVAPDPQFLFNLTEQAFSAPIPPGTPDHEPRSRFVPGTGPYRIVAATRKTVRFTRNPHFHEWSHAAQPGGNPDAILWKSVPTVGAAVDAVEQGRADYVYGLIPPARFQRLELHSPEQLHSSPSFSVEFAPFNTHRAPFDDVRVRRALNYAIDRSKIARLYGGPVFATPACQTIAPGLPGYLLYCPYTRSPRSSGGYAGPDLATARRLIAASGTAGERVDVWARTDESYIPPTVPSYVAGVLRRLGFRVWLHRVPSTAIPEARRERFQMSVDGDWVADYPYPSSYLPLFFGCGGGNSNGYYCDPNLDREMRTAGRLELTDPSRSSALWESIDRQLTDRAVWLPTVTERNVDLVSKRLHNYEYNPVWGFLVDQSWLR